MTKSELHEIMATSNFNYKETIDIKSDLTITLNQLKSGHLQVCWQLKPTETDHTVIFQLFLSVYCFHSSKLNEK